MSRTGPFVKPSKRRSEEAPSQELAAFLLQMADVVSSQPVANVRLGKSLRRLAAQVKRNGLAIESGSVASQRAAIVRPRPTFPMPPPSELAALDESGVVAFIRNPDRTKDQLVELAAHRFGMARSQLRKVRLEEVRRSLESALRHESSIEILGVEAAKGGAARKS